MPEDLDKYSPGKIIDFLRKLEFLAEDPKSTVFATRTPGPSLAYTLGVARRHRQLLAGDQTQQTCRLRAPAQKIRISPKERRLRPNQLRRLRPKLRYTLGIARRKSQLLTRHYTEQTCLQPDQEPTPNQQGSEYTRGQYTRTLRHTNPFVFFQASTLGVNPVVLLGFTLAVLRRYSSP
ncbi:hypothetical protein NQ315_016741 [Exocentrus adspersus]|uniref:Uncharacterized protein n=1 Tax=Exocentrus adspersus TaxID=1586481 RepID=A0AAV8VCX7_9CUCU|nr:hypothetical protein NQ315_016741 [Exocentrus adspersus]